MFDVVDRGLSDALGEQHNAIGHLFWQTAVVPPDHRGNWNANIGENVGRGCDDGISAKQQDQRGEHDKRLRSL